MLHRTKLETTVIDFAVDKPLSINCNCYGGTFTEEIIIFLNFNQCKFLEFIIIELCTISESVLIRQNKQTSQQCWENENNQYNSSMFVL